MAETNTCPQKEDYGLEKANNYLAIHLHKLLSEEKCNVFFSPFSIAVTMGMVINAAESDTASEIIKAFGLDLTNIGTDHLVLAFQTLLSSLMENDDNFILKSACVMICQPGSGIKESFKSNLEKFFKAMVLEVDCRAYLDTIIKQINRWVQEITNNMITDVVDSLDRTTVMALLNAVYFKGNWLRKFDEARTSPQNFYCKGDKNQLRAVNMMHAKQFLYYADKGTFKALKLPYVGNEIAMLLLLPRSIDGLGALEDGLTPTFLQDLNSCMREKKVTVALPKFRLDYSKSLVPFFQRLGVEKLFRNGAQLGGASDSKNLFVSEIRHRAVLDVNEEGTEAAAATMMKIRFTGARISPDPEFIVDHPFAFVIYVVKSNLILFMGRVDEL